MPAPAMTEEQFEAACKASGHSTARMSRETGLPERAINRRRQRLAAKGYDVALSPRWTPLMARPQQRLNLSIADGVVIVFSDAHYWPGLVSISHRALLVLIERLKPALVIANGDMLDGATISRHDRNGWEQRPTLKQELIASQERLGEVEAVAGAAEKVWNLGNHDSRFEHYLSKNAPAFEGVPGTSLPEHFPNWQFSVSTVLNAEADHPVMVKHRNRNGVHAAYNNTLTGGISTVTGHLHRLLVTPWGDYRGRRYGVDTGCLADPNGPQFTYSEDAPNPHGEGFAVLTFRDSRLQPPELVEVVDGVAVFRGQEVIA